MVTVVNAQVSAVDPRTTLSADIQPEITLPKSAIIGLIPRDDNSLKAASQQLLPRMQRVIIYTGPFMVRAHFRLAGEMPLRNLLGGTPGEMLAVTEAEIYPVQAEISFQPRKPAVMILSKSWIRLYHAA
jgi:hypothetical protein